MINSELLEKKIQESGLKKKYIAEQLGKPSLPAPENREREQLHHSSDNYSVQSSEDYYINGEGQNFFCRRA